MKQVVFGTNYTQFQTQSQSSNITYTLPALSGSAGDVLSTNSSGVLSWQDPNSLVTGDDLGNHSATQNLDMNSQRIVDAGSITMNEDTWIGISSSTERIVFNGSSGDINILNSDLNIGGTSANSYKLRVYNNSTNFGISSDLEDAPGTTVYAVYGRAKTSTSNYAGYFVGNVSVSGSVSKSSGSFKIDHPLDPENKYLYHSFVESPDMMNIYNGNVTLNSNGEAVVQLPDYFEALNMEFRYQLTPIGAPGPNIYIAEEISGNTFKIAGGTSGMKVSWQVTGIRNDPYAQENRIEVEVDKNTDEKGKYLHPILYGKSIKSGINYNQNKENIE
jgi:hypothetical protein